MQELRKTAQGINESVESYTQRFRQILRLATRVRRQQPGNLNNAVNLARREEEALTEKARKEGKTYIKENKVEIQDDKPKNIFAKPLDKNYEDDLSKMFEKLEVKLLNNIEKQGKFLNKDQSKIRCYTCGQQGHFANACRTNNQRNYGRPNNQNYNQRPNNQNYNQRPNNYGRRPNFRTNGGQNFNRRLNTVEYDYGYYDQYNQEYDDFSYEDPYYYDVPLNFYDQEFYPVPKTKKYKNNKAAALPKRGFTEESLRKAQENRRKNHVCGNC
ncbi:hypothetical protein C1646_769860, partial [Rhizophagus diaphanus]